MPPLLAKKQQRSSSPVIEHMEDRIRSKIDQGIFITANSISRGRAKWPLLTLLMERCNYSFREYVEFAKSYPTIQPYLLGPHGAARHNIATFLGKLPPQRLLAACSEPVSYPDAKRLVFDYCLYKFPKDSVNKPLDLDNHSLVHSLLSLMLLKHNHVEPNLSAHDIRHVQELCLEHMPIQNQVLQHISADEATRQAAQQAISARSSGLAKMEGQMESLSTATDPPERGGLQRILDAKLDRQDALDQFVGKLRGEIPFTAFGEHQFNELPLMNEPRIYDPLESTPDRGLLDAKFDDKTLDVNSGNRAFDVIRNARTEKDLENILDQDPLRNELHLMLVEKDTLLPTHLLHRIWGNASLEPSLEFSQQLARCANHDQTLIMELAVDSRLFHHEVPELYKTIREELHKDPKLKSPEMVEAMVRCFPNTRWEPPVPNLDFYRWALDQKPSQEVKRVLLSKGNLPREIVSRLAEDEDPKILEEVSKKFEGDAYVLCALASNPMRTNSERDVDIKSILGILKKFSEIKHDVTSHMREKYPDLAKNILSTTVTYGPPGNKKTYRVSSTFHHPGGKGLLAMYDKMDITNIVRDMHREKAIPNIEKIIKGWEEIERTPFLPPESASDFLLEKEENSLQSNTLTIFDASIGKVRFLHGKDSVPEKIHEVHQEFANFVRSDNLPCIGAKTAFGQGSYAIGIYQQPLGSVKQHEENARRIVADLQKYESYRSSCLDKGNPFVTFVAVFPEQSLEGIGNADELLDDQLDACEKVFASQRPDEGTPMHNRNYFVPKFWKHALGRSHRFQYPALVFNGVAQFDLLYKAGALSKVRDAVIKRDIERSELPIEPARNVNIPMPADAPNAATT